jgi:hypothetical protein
MKRQKRGTVRKAGRKEAMKAEERSTKSSDAGF